jgi:hypothetical protein
VLYPFGFGLSYSEFELETVDTQFDGNNININVSVTNKGEVVGKEVVQMYYGAPMGGLGNPLKSLVAYKKTKNLEPNQSQVLSFSIDIKQLASYDDSGVTGHPFSFVLEAGEYPIYLGNSVRHALEVMRVELKRFDRC